MHFPDLSHIPHLDPQVARQAVAAAVCHAAGQPLKRLLIVDMSQPSLSPRLWALDVSDPQAPTLVLQTQVANGYGSDPQRTGHATRFSNVENSGMTSLGLYEVGESYIGKYGHGYRLTGLSSTNSNARVRDVMLHPAPYVSATHVGPSGGCAAVPLNVIPKLDKAWGTLTGAFLYISGPGAPTPHCAALNPWKLPAYWASALQPPGACTQGATS
jgi:hypothetical protein